jgi:tetratricopeptide (TPR) repeat protein
MKLHHAILNCIAASLLGVCLASIAWADQAKLDDLFKRLAESTPEQAGRIQTEIQIEWDKSGSPAMDLLLQRGRDALELGDTQKAIEHFTALTDHAPEFAEGWNALATAYFTAGEFGPSVEDIAKTLSLNPKHFGALGGLGMILEEIGKPEKALEAYKAALAIHPHLTGIKDRAEALETEISGQDL